jgi:hypothetical protein
MDWNVISDFFLFRTWWSYGAGGHSWFGAPYHAFNLFEGAVWVVLSGLVLRRFLRYRHSKIEAAYALAFLTFGLTDFREAYSLESWLVLCKAANLLALIWLRSHVINRYYPESKAY